MRLCQCQHGGNLRLHIRGEARVGHGFYIGLLQRLGPAHQNGIALIGDIHAHFRQLGTDAIQMLGNDIFDKDLTAGGGHSSHVGSGLDLVGNDAIAAAGKAVYAADLDGVGAGTLDVSPHGIEEVGKVYDVRLLGGVVDDGDTVGQHGGHHNIHGGAHGNNIQIYIGARETAAPGGGLNEAAFHRDLGPHGGEALDVLVDGADAEVTAAGHGNRGLAKAAQQRADEIIRGADLPGKLVGGVGAADGVTVHLYRVTVQHPDAGTKLFQNGEQQRYIADLRNVFDAAGAIDQKGCGNNGNSGIFGTADGNLAEQGLAAVNDILIHKNPFLRWFMRRRPA